MESQEIQKHIDRVVGTEGTLRIPSWWMHKILSDLVKYCEENESAGNAVDISTIEGYVQEQLKALKADISKGFVAKEEGKGLSSNDYTNDEKEKLAGLENYDDSELKEEIAELGKTQNLYAYPTVGEFDSHSRKVVNLGGDRVYMELGEITPDKPEGILRIPVWSERYVQDKKDGKYLEYNSELLPYASLFIGNEEEQYVTLKITPTNRGELEYIPLRRLINPSGPITLEIAVDNFGQVYYRNYYHGENKSIKVYGLYIAYELDEAFIPNTIARKEELTELSTEVGKRNVGTEDTDESVEEPEIQYASTLYVDNAIASAITNELNATFNYAE